MQVISRRLSLNLEQTMTLVTRVPEIQSLSPEVLEDKLEAINEIVLTKGTPKKLGSLVMRAPTILHFESENLAERVESLQKVHRSNRSKRIAFLR